MTRDTQEIVIAGGADAKNWTVLIVDDEPDNLGVAEKVLSFQGATVYTAANGREGLEVLLQHNNVSFILLDLSMPEMNGWEMLEVLRGDPDLRYIPVIALTAHAMAGDRERALDAGFHGYIAKPFRLSTFFTEIQRVIEPFIRTA
jgi:CheY-like chemotaxis protein